MQLRQITDRLRQSLWFIPGLGIVLAAIAATVMLAFSHALVAAQSHLPLVFGGGPEGARGMLQAIAGSVVTVAGVVFSITVVALQLTSTQFSPRVLRNFMRDRATQVTLAVFMATIVYALLVLRTIRSAEPDGTGAFVPGLAVTGALLLAFLSLVMLIYFIHHIGVRIQVSSIIESVADETLATIHGVDRQLGNGRQAATDGDLLEPDAHPVMARHSGYLQYVSVGSLLRTAREHDLRVALLVPPGGWVQAGVPLLRVAGGASEPDAELQDWLLSKVALGSQRSMQQDVGFGVQQLVDIAVKALSPGINDPTTATQCIDRLTQVLVAVGQRDDVPRVLADEDGAPRLQLRFPTFSDLLRQAIEQVRHYGADAPVVVRHLALSLVLLWAAVPAHRRAAIRREAERLALGTARLDEGDRTEVRAILAETLAGA